MTPSGNPGALIISLDFELHWGVRDRRASAAGYRRNLLGVRSAIPAILRLFEERAVAATWATVGFLFARDREELLSARPALRPSYRSEKFDAYVQRVGLNELDDPLHYASSVLDTIRSTPRQEIASHTLSHYYCLEAGQSAAEFEADLACNVKIAAAHGVTLRSIVFPRNQRNPAYDHILSRHGITSYRGNPSGSMYAPAPDGQHGLLTRATRFVDAYANISGHQTISWNRIARTGPPFDIPASFFLRPWSPRLAAVDPMRLRRIEEAMRHAARANEILHLWWHPHNFGRNLKRNMASLERILDVFGDLRARYGMRSLTMSDAADTAARLAAS